jgi:type II secretory pathway component GspD/PulD (secretin)
MTKRLKVWGLLLSLALVAGGCAAGKAFRQGEAAMKSGDLDEAVAGYRRALQAAPDNANYKIALERATLAASRAHLDRAREFEQKDQLEAALGEYKQASEYDPSNRGAADKAQQLEKTIRDRIEAARPKPAITQMRERARAASAAPILNPSSRDPLHVHFPNASVKDILTFIGNLTGINITYDRDVQDRPTSVQLDDVTLEQALNQIMVMNQLSYKVVNEHSIFVFQDNPQTHLKYDEQVVRTFYISHGDATEITQILSTIVRMPGLAMQPGIIPNKTANTITVRGTAAMVGIIEKIIAQNDKPHAEIVVDVEILEVNRTRAKSYGLNLSEYDIGGLLSPEVSPSATTTPTTTTPTTGTTPGTTATTTAASGASTAPSALRSPPPFNLNTISRGLTTADFYLAVPTALVKFLESDTQTKLIAKPQLRGAEGSKISLKLGDRIPVISTAFTPIAGGGAGVNPLSTYNYQDIGVNIEMTPRVTLEGDIILDLVVDDSSLGANVSVAGQSVPSFGQRTVTTHLRLRDGESNLLAGLLREDDRKALQGFPGAIHVPILKQLFSANDNSTTTTDIVMLLTPHIVRTHEITDTDLAPIYIGSQQNLGVGGPPPLIAPPQEPGAPAAPAPTPAGPQTLAPSGTTIAAPPGTSPVPGTVLVPTPPAVAPAPPVTVPPEPPAGVPVEPAPTRPVGPPPASEVTPTTTPGVGAAQVIVSPPGTTFRVGGGPYTVPISVINASRLSTITLTLTYDPTKLKVRTVQEGSFMRSGGVDVSFAQQVNNGRVDITLSRAGDATGASGTGLLAAVLFDAVAPGSSTLSLSGAATGPGATAMGLQFRPVTVIVQQ